MFKKIGMRRQMLTAFVCIILSVLLLASVTVFNAVQSSDRLSANMETYEEVRNVTYVQSLYSAVHLWLDSSFGPNRDFDKDSLESGLQSVRNMRLAVERLPDDAHLFGVELEALSAAVLDSGFADLLLSNRTAEAFRLYNKEVYPQLMRTEFVFLKFIHFYADISLHDRIYTDKPVSVTYTLIFVLISVLLAAVACVMVFDYIFRQADNKQHNAALLQKVFKKQPAQSSAGVSALTDSFRRSGMRPDKKLAEQSKSFALKAQLRKTEEKLDLFAEVYEKLCRICLELSKTDKEGKDLKEEDRTLIAESVSYELLKNNDVKRVSVLLNNISDMSREDKSVFKDMFIKAAEIADKVTECREKAGEEPLKKEDFAGIKAAVLSTEEKELKEKLQ